MSEDQYDRFKHIQLEAVSDILNFTDEYFYRKLCRWYSKEFSTELTKVYELRWDFILKHYFESMLEQQSFDQIYELASEKLLPQVKKHAEAEYDAWIIKEQRKEAERAKKRALKKQKVVKPKEEPIVESKPFVMNFEDEKLDGES